MILPAVVSALFASRLRARANFGDNFDPEKGDTEGGEDGKDNADRDDDDDDREDEDEDDSEVGDDDDIPRDEDDEINEIIHSVDFPQRNNDNDNKRTSESLPHDSDNDNDDNEGDSRKRRGRRLRRFSTASTPFFSTLSKTKPSTWWSRIKSTLNPPTASDSIDSYIPHYRLTPILSGVVIPFSILLEIPGLTEDWYIRTGQGHKIVETRPNTPILEAGLAISLACAVVANGFLVMRFLEYKVLVTTVLCIVFLTLHDLINITTVTIFGVEHRFDDGFTYGQAYWMTLCSTVASLFTNITLIYDLFRIPDFAKSGSGLTRKQRSLVIIVIILLCYIALGGLINSILLDLSFINGLYFTIVTIETIGFGDIVPKTTGARIWVCLYACAGIVNLGVAVGMCRETVLERLEVGYRRRVASVRKRRRELRRRRLVERRWRQGIEWRLREKGEVVWVRDPRIGVGGGRGGAARTGKLEFGEMWESLKCFLTMKKRKHHGQIHHHHHHGMHLNLDGLTPAQLEAAALEAGVSLDQLLPPDYMMLRQRRKWKGKEGRSRDASSERRSDGEEEEGGVVGLEERIRKGFRSPDAMPLTHARMGRMISMLGRFALAVQAHGAKDGVIHEDDSASGIMPPPTSATATTTAVPCINLDNGNENGNGNGSLPTQSYESFRKRMAKEEKRAFIARLVVAWSLFFLFWVVGSAIFQQTEKWSYGIALYFCFVSFTTIGYGDYTPTTPAGRSVFVVWALLGVATMTILISVLSEAFSTRYRKALHTHTFENAVKRYRLRNPTITTEPYRPTISGVRPRGISVSSSFQQQPFPITAAAGSTVLSYPQLPIRTAAPKVFPRTRTISIARSGSREPEPEPEPEPDKLDPPPRIPSPTPSETAQQAQQKLEALPQEVLQHARNFHDHVRYFVGMHSMAEPDNLCNGDDGVGGRGGLDTGVVPESLKRLLSDITGAERIGERVKEEILKDEDARKTLFALSIENSLVKMIESAEDALEALTLRNVLEAHQLPRVTTEVNVINQVLHEEAGEHDNPGSYNPDDHDLDHQPSLSSSRSSPTVSNIPPPSL